MCPSLRRPTAEVSVRLLVGCALLLQRWVRRATGKRWRCRQLACSGAYQHRLSAKMPGQCFAVCRPPPALPALIMLCGRTTCSILLGSRWPPRCLSVRFACFRVCVAFSAWPFLLFLCVRLVPFASSLGLAIRWVRPSRLVSVVLAVACFCCACCWGLCSFSVVVLVLGRAGWLFGLRATRTEITF